jgi:hypothetical protein
MDALAGVLGLKKKTIRSDSILVSNYHGLFFTCFLTVVMGIMVAMVQNASTVEVAMKRGTCTPTLSANPFVRFAPLLLGWLTIATCLWFSGHIYAIRVVAAWCFPLAVFWGESLGDHMIHLAVALLGGILCYMAGKAPYDKWIVQRN